MADANRPMVVAAEFANAGDATITNIELYIPIHEAAAAGHTEVAQAMLQHEDLLSSRFRSSSIPDRVRKVAERHGQLETAMAIQDTWLAPA